MKPVVDLDLLLTLFDRTRGRVRYELGAKPPLGADSHALVEADCSGYIRWLLHRCSGVVLPEGSQQQWAYVRDVLKWPEFRYSEIGEARKTWGPLFIAFKRAEPRRHGHVWLVYYGRFIGAPPSYEREIGRTIECYTRVGVGSRPARQLAGIAAAAYAVPVRRG